MRRARGPRHRGARQRGVILILVLFILAIVVAMALALGREVRVEVAASARTRDAVRLRALADSAIDRALAELRLDTTPGDDLTATWRDGDAIHRAQARDGGRWWFLLAEPDPGDGRVVRYGLRDEAGRLDINIATAEQLSALPGITAEAVDGIVDYRDEDDDALEQGAESAYYGSLPTPYQAKNQFFESLDELRRVKGVDDAMLWGEDRNRNGLLDPGEDDGDKSFPPDDADGALDYGIAEYLTVFSRDPNTTSQDEARLVWGDTSPADLDAALADAGMAEAARQRLVLTRARGTEVDSMGELLAFPEIDTAAAAVLLDQVALTAGPAPGRINVNTAPREVLAGLPGLEAADVDAIMTARLTAGADRATAAWLLDVLQRQKVQVIADLVTGRSEQFTAHVVVQLDDTHAFRRVEVLIDRSAVPIRVLVRRDLTALGFPFPAERGEESP